MNDDRNQNSEQKPQARQMHHDEWQKDLNPYHLAGQNIGREAESSSEHLTAFHLYLDGTSYEDIAKKTGLTQTAAKVAVHRLRGKLRQILIARIAETVDNESDLEAELSEFVSLLS